MCLTRPKTRQCHRPCGHSKWDHMAVSSSCLTPCNFLTWVTRPSHTPVC
ncbi:polyprotein [Gossypium arboreum]|uniref:Polyprotein n=1 Tax=Gossypium arboreum TaxID=29729 RepID=A0A0B0MX83_GOSAR|nr:polyprotein [Gossypium arboreum]